MVIMMSYLAKFIAYLNEQVQDHSIYVWGAQGQKGNAVTEAWIRRRETSEANANRAIAFWKKQVEAGFGNVLRAFDCSGLGVYFLMENKLLGYDTTAHGLMGKCDKITRDKLRIGDFVFKVNSSGRATHIGYVVDNELNVIEAKGRDYGVIKRPMDKGWNAYGRPPYWTEAEVKELQDRSYIFTRVLKYGCYGKDVCELKELLLVAGFGGLTLTNKSYLSTTRSVVKAFQKAKGLTVDGKAGKQTISALGGRWKE